MLYKPSEGYTQFLNDVNGGQVKTATIDSNGAVSGKLANGDQYTSQIPVALQDNSLPGLLEKHHVQITAEGPPSTTFLTIVLNLLPFILLVGVFWYLGRRARRQMGAGLGGIPGLGGLTGSRAKLYDEERPSTTFADIAGYDGAKQEVAEGRDTYHLLWGRHRARSSSAIAAVQCAISAAVIRPEGLSRPSPYPQHSISMRYCALDSSVPRQSWSAGGE